MNEVTYIQNISFSKPFNRKKGREVHPKIMDIISLNLTRRTFTRQQTTAFFIYNQ